MIGRDIKVQLEDYEVELAVSVGVRRQMASLGRTPGHGFAGDAWGAHIDGAGGEIAFAKASGAYWGGSVNTFKAPDVGRVQVRTTDGLMGRTSLIVRPDDADYDIFVLVIGRMPSYTIPGWIAGKFAKSNSFLKSPGGRPPAYFVAPHYLQPFPLPTRP